jgi:drug/metabolite transporter (DMT)-like permease
MFGGLGLGIIYVVISNISFAVNTVSARRGMLSGSALQGVYLSVLLGTPIFVIAALISTQIFHWGDITVGRYWVLASAGVLHFLFGRYCNYRTLGILGANRANPLVQSNALFSVALAIPLLGETVTGLMWGGIALLMVAPSLSAPRRRKPSPVSGPPAAATEVRPVAGSAPPTTPKAVDALPTAKVVEGYFFGVLNALAWGTSPLLIRYGLQDSGGLGVLGALVAYTAAAAVLLPTLASAAIRDNLRTMDKSARGWFLSSTATVSMAQLFRFMALSVAPVAIVVPLLRAGGVFVLPMSYLINRKVESFEPRVLGAVVLSLAGAILLVI